MARNPQRREAKAARRKKLLGERRRLDLLSFGGSLAAKVRRAKAAPIHSCLVQGELFETGYGAVVLTRKTGAGTFALSAFLVDVFCLGVKDAVFRELDEDERESFVDSLGVAAPFEAADPSYARKLLRDAVAYARSLGLEPPSNYAAVEAFFGDVDADACKEEFQFGHEGKPLYAPGPMESPTQIRRRLDLLTRRLGADGFAFEEIEDVSDNFEGLDDADDDEDDDADLDEEAIEGAYDPDVAPDPDEWLALDEQERMNLALDYHRRAGFSQPNERIHSVLHAVVENQIAMGDELPVRRTVERLMAEGLDRHQAIHAVASVLVTHISDAIRDSNATVASPEAYNADIEQLTIESWRRDFEDEDEEE